jgi:hypothetical protein
MDSPLNTLKELRQRYHRQLQEAIWYIATDGIPSNADRESKISVAIAKEMLLEAGQQTNLRAVAQRSGQTFTDATLEFLRDAFLQLEHLRPGSWKFSTSQARVGIAAFYQYEHLALLEKLLENLEHGSKDLRAMFAGNYLVKPDIVIARIPVKDALINDKKIILNPGENVALHTPLREVNNRTALLHASVSCKWTLRSDRAQNARTEALNLMRDRKGHTPHIVVVTGEPLPSRLASLAMGTGDIDCVYHMALSELESAINKHGDETARDLLDTLVRGRRLRDISDLPFDLAA